MSGLRKMVTVCENHAQDYGILFNGKKSELLFFKGHNSKEYKGYMSVNGSIAKNW